MQLAASIRISLLFVREREEGKEGTHILSILYCTITTEACNIKVIMRGDYENASYLGFLL